MPPGPLTVLHAHSGNLYGGVESILTTLARRRACSPAIEPTFALCFEARLAQELRQAGVAVLPLGKVRARAPWTVWRARRRLRAALGANRAGLVVCHSTWSQALLAPVARAEGCPILFWLHGRTQGRHWLDRLARFTPPQAILAVSHSTAETARNLYPGIPPEVIYAPLTVREAEFEGVDRAAVRSELQTPREAVVIIQVSRLESGKGQSLHLEALGRLREYPSWVCWMVGGPERPAESAYLEELKAMARTLGIADRVRFTGCRRDVPRLLCAADLFCQPNLDTEGLGIVFMEAFYAQLPVVTTAIGGAVELVDESNGRLLKLGDVAGVADALRQLIDSPGLRKRLGQAGRRRLDEFCSPQTQMTRLADLFWRTAQRGTRQPGLRS